MKNIVFGVIGAAFSFGVAAQSIDLPTVKAGDTWTYQETKEVGTAGWTPTHVEVTVSHASASSIYFTAKQSGSTQLPSEQFSGADWSRVRNLNNKDTVVNQPLSFPLKPGKTWAIQYTEQNPNKQLKYEQRDSHYTVVGYESVEVPAGKFQALKIEEEGHWTAETLPANTVVQGAQVSQNGTTMVTQANRAGAVVGSGRTYKAFWYVPETKRWVKSVEEMYNSNGVRTERYTSELESFKVN